MNEHAQYINDTFSGGVSAYVSDLQSRADSGSVSQAKVNAELSRIGYSAPAEPSYSYNFASPETSRSYDPVGGAGSIVDIAKNNIPTSSNAEINDLRATINSYNDLLKPMMDMFNRYDELDPKSYNVENIPNMPNNTAIGNVQDTIVNAKGDFLYLFGAGVIILLLFLRK